MAYKVNLEGWRWEVKCCHNPRLQVQPINTSSAAGRKEGVIDLEGRGIFHLRKNQSWQPSNCFVTTAGLAPSVWESEAVSNVEEFPTVVTSCRIKQASQEMLQWSSVPLLKTCGFSSTPGANSLQKAGVTFIVSAPFRFTSANVFSAVGNMRLCLAGKKWNPWGCVAVIFLYIYI